MDLSFILLIFSIITLNICLGFLTPLGYSSHRSPFQLAATECLSRRGHASCSGRVFILIISENNIRDAHMQAKSLQSRDLLCVLLL